MIIFNEVLIVIMRIYLFLFLLINVQHALPGQYNCSVVTIADFNTFNGRSPDIDNNVVVWQAIVKIANREESHIFMYKDNSTIQVSDNTSISSRFPRIDNERIVWEAKFDSSFQIFVNDGTTQKMLSDGANIYYQFPTVQGNVVAWTGKGDVFANYGDGQLLITDGTSTQNSNVVVNEQTIYWRGRDSNGIYQIYKNDGSGQEKISDGTSRDNIFIDAYENTAVWQGRDSTGMPQVYRNSGNGQELLTGSMPNGGGFPRIHGNIIVFISANNDGGQIYKISSGIIELVSDGSSTMNTTPRIDGTTIFWQGWSEKDQAYRIYKNSGSGQELVGGDLVINHDLRVSQNSAVWTEFQSTGLEIVASICVKEEVIPTLKGWSIIILGILLNIVSIVAIRTNIWQSQDKSLLTSMTI